MDVDATFARVAHDYAAANDDVESGKIFRSFGLKTNSKFFAFARDGELVVKLPEARVDALLGSGEGTEFRSGSRVMREWVTLTPATKATMVRRLTEAHHFVAGLQR